MQPNYVYRAAFRSAYDADTIRLDVDAGFGIVLTNQPFRLMGINAPEMRGPEREAGKRARDFLREYVKGKALTVQTFKSSNKGKYGRWLAVLYADDVNVNQLLVREGHATPFMV